MTSINDILVEMRSHPGGARFADACKVVTSYFGAPRQNGTSHKVWKMPWAGDPRINMQKGKGGLAKTYQVRQAVQAIDKLVAQRRARAAKAAATSKKRVANRKTRTKNVKARKPKSKKRRS